jgi:hypothetical protein
VDGFNAAMVLGIAGHRPAILLFDDAYDGQTLIV